MKTDEEIMLEMAAKDPVLAERVQSEIEGAEAEALARYLKEAKQRRFFVDDVPLHVLHIVVAKSAHLAVPLILAAHRNMRMRGSDEVLLVRGVWEAAGYSPTTDRRRWSVLAQVRNIPEIMLVEERRSPIARYLLRRGPAWAETPSLRISGETYWVDR
jgi:hypothetical protein